MIVVYIACTSEEEARNISRGLLERRLIACANIFPVKSMYWWKGAVEESNEHIIIAKTVSENFESVKKEVISLHSYEVPLIECWNVDEISDDYLKYLNEEVNKDG